MSILGDDGKPSLEDLVHYGTKGMKWGVRKAKPTTSEILGARVRQRDRHANANLAVAQLNLAATTGTKSQQKAAVRAFEKTQIELRTSEDRVTASRLTKGEKWASVILAGPVGLVVIGGSALGTKSVAKAVDKDRKTFSR